MDRVEEIALRIALSAAYDDCVVTGKHFEDATRGAPIPVETREEFQQHVQEVLEDPETRCCTIQTDVTGERKCDVFYHPETNTLIILPQDPNYQAFVSRPRDGWTQFDLIVEMGKSTAEQQELPIHRSIHELHPELRAPEQQASQSQSINKADQELRDAIERRFQEELKQMLKRHADELKRAADRQEAEARHLRELKALEASKQRDFDAHRRTRQERERLQKEEKERQRFREAERRRHQEEDRRLRIVIDKKCDSLRQQAIDRYKSKGLHAEDPVGDSVRLAKELQAIEEQRERQLKQCLAERAFGRRIEAEEKAKEPDRKQREALDKQYENDKQALLDQQARELKQSHDPTITAQEHAQELKALEERRQRDLERHQREQEAEKRLRQEYEDRKRREAVQRGREGPSRDFKLTR
jgi:hypothetical protein